SRAGGLTPGPPPVRPQARRSVAWLNSGVPATEVTERAGHSVDVLLKVYAKCIEGQKEIINGRIQDALND
ncbi:MAG: integrase family protein, partial [Actinoallomurus sp.]|nr:integrase family protein [Actinoallomurus sp.]